MIDYEKEIDSYLKRLFPITRSITGEGNRKTLKILQEIIPLKMSFAQEVNLQLHQKKAPKMVSLY